MKGKEYDLNQTSRELCSMLIFRGVGKYTYPKDPGGCVLRFRINNPIVGMGLGPSNLLNREGYGSLGLIYMDSIEDPT